MDTVSNETLLNWKVAGLSEDATAIDFESGELERGKTVRGFDRSFLSQLSMVTSWDMQLLQECVKTLDGVRVDVDLISRARNPGFPHRLELSQLSAFVRQMGRNGSQLSTQLDCSPSAPSLACDDCWASQSPHQFA